MATLPQAITAAAGVPAQIENNFRLPGVSKVIKKIASMMPAGPNFLPALAAKTPTLPTMPIFSGPTITSSPYKRYIPPAPPAAPNPARGQMTYLGSPNSARGTLTYLGD